MIDPTFTVADVLSRVRELKSDASYASASCRVWAYDALMELYTQAPKTRVDDGGDVRNIPNMFSADNDVVGCSILYLPLVIDYVLGRAFMSDGDSQEHSARAAQHFQLFYQRAHWIQHGPVQFNDRTLGVMRGPQ